jgi:hypothetical protein
MHKGAGWGEPLTMVSVLTPSSRESILMLTT